ncbi:hypothetical protein HYG89_05330 [Acinetobacter sp. SwsAc5]|uniref:hypothetical protein n=1 Tax=Acinetobacter sp. SwsAc5 TaxID=2749438 RepID=UPI0015BD9BCA|nr:hypothetical protein [Acinetobacter sp. SwsAc5]NWK51990.1 hypothetical protein [Acinetobacter sp. SwsAc5]
MKISSAILIKALTQAVAAANSNFDDFAKNLTVTHEFTTNHGAIISDFIVVYKCPNTGIQIKHYDSMLWNDVDDILENGIESYEIAEYDKIKEFHNNERVYLSESGEWVQSDNEDVNDLLINLSHIYSLKLVIANFIPNWQTMVFEHLKSQYGDNGESESEQ